MNCGCGRRSEQDRPWSFRAGDPRHAGNCTGYRVFLLLNSTTGTTDLGAIPYGLVILTNALMAIPYALKVLDNRCVTWLNAITRSVSR